MQTAVLSYADTYMRCSAILNFVDEPSAPETKSWGRRAVFEMMKKTETESELGEKDGKALVRIVGTYQALKGLEAL